MYTGLAGGAGGGRVRSASWCSARQHRKDNSCVSEKQGLCTDILTIVILELMYLKVIYVSKG